MEKVLREINEEEILYEKGHDSTTLTKSDTILKENSTEFHERS